jgi:WAS/WASL-interacting protein
MALHGKSPSDDLLDLDALFATEPEADVPSATVPVAARVRVPPSGRTAQEFADEPLDFADEPALRADPVPVRTAPVASLPQQPLVVPQRPVRRDPSPQPAFYTRALFKRSAAVFALTAAPVLLYVSLASGRRADAGSETGAGSVGSAGPRSSAATVPAPAPPDVRPQPVADVTPTTVDTAPPLQPTTTPPPVQPAEPVAAPAVKPAAIERPAPEPAPPAPKPPSPARTATANAGPAKPPSGPRDPVPNTAANSRSVPTTGEVRPIPGVDLARLDGASIPPAVPLAPPQLQAPPPAAVDRPEVASAVTTSPRPPETAASPAEARTADRDKVRAVLSRYEAAYTGLDAGAAARVYPAVDQRALSRAFSALDSQQVTFNDCRIQVGINLARATCTGTMTWRPKVGAGARTQARSWQFDLKQVGSDWQIGSVRIQ